MPRRGYWALGLFFIRESSTLALPIRSHRKHVFHLLERLSGSLNLYNKLSASSPILKGIAVLFGFRFSVGAATYLSQHVVRVHD